MPSAGHEPSPAPRFPQALQISWVRRKIDQQKSLQIKKTCRPKLNLKKPLFGLEAGELSPLVVAFGGSVMANVERLSTDLLVHLNLRHIGRVVGSALRGALVAKSAFWIRHYFFSRCKVCLRNRGLYLLSSRRSVVLRLFLVVV